MDFKVGLLSISFVTFLLASVTQAGIVYLDPAGGWTYQYDGQVSFSGAQNALDGTWKHENDSDTWDGLGLSTGQPGGVQELSDGVNDYVRFQDTGDPRQYGHADPGSNRKLYFTRNLFHEGGLTLLDTGVTLSFRIRLATRLTGPLDDRYPESGSAPMPWPAGGKGYQIDAGGKGMIGIRSPGKQEDSNGRLISFVLAQASEDIFLKGKNGLVMNSRNGSTASDSVDFGMGELQIVELDDLTVWHEFWVTIIADTTGGGTHKITIWKDGDVEHPEEHHVTASTAFEQGHELQQYLALGLPATSLDGAFDVDFVAYKVGLSYPIARYTMGTLSEQPGWWGQTVVLEEGFSDQLEVTLNSQPNYDVNVILDPNNLIDLGNGPGIAYSLDFSPTAWDQPQTVTVTALNNESVEGIYTCPIFVTAVSQDPNFSGDFSLPVIAYILDNDAPDVSINIDDGVLVTEADPDWGDTYTLRLTQPPTQTVLVTPVEVGIHNVVISPPSFSFSPTELENTFTITAYDDDVLEGDPHSIFLDHIVATTDPAYHGLAIPSIIITLRDNECGAWGYKNFDFDHDCTIGIKDLAAMANAWLNCSLPEVEGCTQYN